MEKELVFLDINKFVPYADIEFYVKTSWGEIRKAINYSNPAIVGYRFIDCTNPLQNRNLSPYDILGWRYVDENYMNELAFYTNHYARQKEGEEILSNIKEPFIKILIASIKARIQRK